jgi:hypothetical protein
MSDTDEEIVFSFGARSHLRDAVHAVVAAPAARNLAVAAPVVRRKMFEAPSARNQQQHDSLTLLMRNCKRARRAESELQCQREQQTQQQQDQHPGHDWHLAAAFSSTASVSALAKEMHKTRLQIREGVQSVALAWIKLQEQSLEDVLVATHGQQVELFFEKIKWDETKQTVTMAFPDSLTRDASRASWNVMVQRRTLGWKIAGQNVTKFQIVVPPVILVGTINADTFYDSLFNQRFSRFLQRFIGIMQRRASLSLSVREGDDDAKNGRLMSWEASAHSAQGYLHSFCPCNLHQNNMLVASTCQIIGRSLIDGMYAYSKLVRTGNFWIRTVLSVEQLITKELAIVFAPPPVAAAVEARLVVDLFFPKPQCKNGKPPSDLSVRNHHLLRDEFLKMLNGPLHNSQILHFCHESVGCQCSSRGNTVKRISKIVVRCLFSKRPVVPQVKEWTAVHQSMTFLAFAASTHNLHRRIFDRSIASVEACRGAASEEGALVLFPAAHLNGASVPQPTQGFIENIDWADMNGKRVSHISKHLMQPSQDLNILLMAVLLGAQEEISTFLFSQQRHAKPLLLLQACAQGNPALTLVQFISSLWAGEHASASLLCRARGCRTFMELIQGDPAAAHDIRRALACVATAAHIRHFHRCKQWPWKLSTVADTTAPQELRERVARDFMEACPKCLDLGFARTLRKRIYHVENLFSPKWQAAILLWASLHDGDTHDIELKHALNKRQNTTLSKFELLAARYVNAEAKSTASRRHATAEAEVAQPLPAPPKTVSASRVSACKSGIQLYHREASRRDRAIGIVGPTSLNPVSKEYWQRIKLEWEAMSPSLQARFNDLAKLESQAAASAARASAACIMPPPQPELQQHQQQQQQQQQHQLVSAFEHPTRSASSEDSIVLLGRANMDTENQWSLSLTRYNSFLDETHSQSKAEGRASFHKLRSASDRQR